MAKKKMSKLARYLAVGGKAIIGSIVVSLVIWFFMLIVGLFVSMTAEQFLVNRPVFLMLFGLIALFVSIVVQGWVLNKLWNWK